MHTNSHIKMGSYSKSETSSSQVTESEQLCHPDVLAAMQGGTTYLERSRHFSQVLELLSEYLVRHPSAASPRLVLRKRNASFDLVGIELNPGPVRGKKLSNMLSQIVSAASSSGPSRKSGKQRKGRKRSERAAMVSNGDTSRVANRVNGIPAAFGFVAPRSYFRTSSTAQRLAAQDSKSSIRVHGCALYGSGINTYSSNTGSTEHGGFGTSALPDRGYAVIAPTEIDPRLAAVSQTYQFYAFRRIVLKYIPFVGTSTTGGLYLAIAKDTEQAEANFALIGASTGASDGTPQDVLEYDPSLMTALWQPAELSFQHTGMDLWETYPNGEEPIDKRLQASIVAIVEQTITTASTPQVQGHLWIEYEVDFYIPGPPLGAN
jgi:hypothetical protein